jgi:hypothetical protein
MFEEEIEEITKIIIVKTAKFGVFELLENYSPVNNSDDEP